MSRVQMVLNFDSTDAEFSRGFEAGIIWSCCAFNGHFQGQVHAVNTEMIMRIAESLHLPFSACESDDDDQYVCVTIGGSADEDRERVYGWFSGDDDAEHDDDESDED